MEEGDIQLLRYNVRILYDFHKFERCTTDTLTEYVHLGMRHYHEYIKGTNILCLDTLDHIKWSPGSVNTNCNEYTLRVIEQTFNNGEEYTNTYKCEYGKTHVISVSHEHCHTLTKCSTFESETLHSLNSQMSSILFFFTLGMKKLCVT